MVALLLCGCGTQVDRTDQLLNQQILANPRPVEGRLSVAVGFARWSASPVAYRGDAPPIPQDRNERVLRGSKPALGKLKPEDLHRTGLLWLYRGQAARAVSGLEAAAERTPTAAVLSDLAAAYLSLADEDRPWLLVDAIAAASRAVERAQDEPYTAFNLALAFERLSLKHEASLAWGRYLELEDDRGWRNEASERLARLHKPTTRDRWEAEKERVAAAAAAGDQVALARWVREFPGQIKELLETELLPAWAAAQGTAAERERLATAKAVSEALARAGEQLYIDAISVIESRASRDLADGHQAYARGLALGGDCSKAMPEFERAQKRLAAESSPLAWAARYRELACLYRSNAQAAEEPLAELAFKLEGRPYPTLLAGVMAMRGVCAMATGRHSQAITFYERSVQLLTRIGDADVARSYGMMDEAYRFLGDRERAWQFRLRALRGASAAGDRRIFHGILAGLARELVGGDRREVTEAVLNEMLANAKAWSEPGATAETLLRRIQLDLLSGLTERAAADIAACAKELLQFQQPADRHRLQSELMIASAEHQLATSPEDSLKSLLAALPRLEASGHGLLLPRALLDLAQVRLSLGEVEEAEEAFERALQVYESRRESTVGESLRINFFSTAQASFDAMIRFQAFDRAAAGAAFSYSERARARGLRDRMGEVRGALEAPSLDQQLTRIPANVTVIAYTVLPERLLAWSLSQRSMKMQALPATRRQVMEIVASLRVAMADADSLDAAKTAAARGFDVLLRPILADLPGGTELVFVPDRELFQVPFSALFDSARGHYLIEDHACLIAPSLELFLISAERRSRAHRPPRRVLAVGDPAFHPAQFPSLPRLPAARKEALAVAALYEKALPLVGEHATKQRILKELSEASVLHLAAHVLVDPRNPLDSFVATADRPGQALRASDLAAAHVADLELVFLAACDTAPGFTDGNREGVAGLARAFLAAGVPAVVATLWAVDDAAASRLAETFHRRLLEGRHPADALRLAQLSLLSESPSSAPFAWAPFQLFQGS